MTETKIYVGLNDSVEKKQLLETEKYVSVLRNVCYGYNTPFSFGVADTSMRTGNIQGKLHLCLHLSTRIRPLSMRSQKICARSFIRNPC